MKLPKKQRHKATSELKGRPRYHSALTLHASPIPISRILSSSPSPLSHSLTHHCSFSLPSQSSFCSSPNMASLLLLALSLLAFTPLSSGNWCVCKDGSDAVLQKTLDYACGAGADCNPIRQNGPCFQPNTVRAHCNYAVNSYFQRKSQSAATCDFAGTATLTASNPSTSGCIYPSSASTSPTATTPSTGGSTSSTTTGSSTMPSSSTATPYGSTSGVLGGIGGGGGLGPSGSGMNSDDSSHGGLRLVDACLSALLVSCFFMIQLCWAST